MSGDEHILSSPVFISKSIFNFHHSTLTSIPDQNHPGQCKVLSKYIIIIIIIIRIIIIIIGNIFSD